MPTTGLTCRLLRPASSCCVEWWSRRPRGTGVHGFQRWLGVLRLRGVRLVRDGDRVVARRVRLREVPAAGWIVSRAFTGHRGTAAIGVAGPLAIVAISWLRRSAYIDADHTGFVTFQRRSAIRTAIALLVLVAASTMLGLLLLGAAAAAVGVLPALLGAVVLLLLLAISFLTFCITMLVSYKSSTTPHRGAVPLDIQFGIGAERLWEVTTIAQKPGDACMAALVMARELTRPRLDAGDTVVVQARTPDLRSRYLRLGFAAGPGNYLVLRQDAPVASSTSQ